ncbi:unnamed protein product [Ranitomeya imitator]|uniref:Cyclin N-terminal domain-containing protein n=1 Tax=Ranitomeya imitator TaxID=111125 RepID=A0ABN9LI89_9NEOB|nr:unnamed protein product [Ranitomeya imitator]
MLSPITEVRCFGVTFDSALSFKPHIQALSTSCRLQLKNISRIRPFLNRQSTKMLEHALIISRLDYCNILFCGLPANTLAPLQSILNSAARLIHLSPRYSSASPLCKSLHFLPFPQRIQFKLLILTYKAIHNLSPPYVSETNLPISCLTIGVIVAYLKAEGKVPEFSEVSGLSIGSLGLRANDAMRPANHSFIQTFVSELWAALECGRDDVRVIHPKPTPVDPIDRSCQKSFLALINLLSSYHAVYELLGKQHLPSKEEYSLREIPTSFVDVFDRLVVVNSVAKINSLFNYDQSHIFGLRLLNVMCCSLDTLLLLESQYKVCEMLFNAQRENTTDSSTGSQ